MNEREQTCKTYYNLAKKRYCSPNSGLNKQFFAEGLREIWSAFDAFLGWKFPATHNRRMQELYSADFQNLFIGWKKSDKFNESIEQLQKLAPVKDMKPVNPKADATLNNPNDLNDLIRLLYRIRSNLDHGAKDLESDTQNANRNRQLVEHAFYVTFEILEKTLMSKDII